MNTRRTNVRKRTRSAVRPGLPPPVTLDRRVQRTRHMLGAALMELMLERPFQDITVQEVLDRAGVGRATFYAHFQNKRDLFLSEHERFLGWLEGQLDESGARPGRLAPVTEFFAHVAEQGPFLRALRESGEVDLVWQLVTGELARMIERRMAVLSPAPPHALLPPGVQARFAAGALAELLQWWLGREERPTPEQMDDIWHDMVWRALRGRSAPTPSRRPMTAT